ncbi:MAG: hypothetical protein WC949_04205 [Candidatus Paceibacterota bacterium]
MGRDLCYANVARIKEDLSACDGIQNKEMRGACYADVGKKDPAVCDQIQDQETKDYCYGFAK